MLSAEPKGALLPLGGLDAGYKGFGLALLIEALTAGLSGHGRADPPEGWGGTVFVQVLDPAAFGGLAAFKRQMDHMVDAAHASKPRAGVTRVRLPGEAGMARLREQREQGVALYPTIMPALVPWAEKLGVAGPEAVLIRTPCARSWRRARRGGILATAPWTPVPTTLPRRRQAGDSPPRTRAIAAAVSVSSRRSG